jgi:glycosyltransferase involved in cell wall biosynthesis
MLLTFEQVGGLSGLRERFPLIELGWAGEREAVARGLQAADLFVMPSIAESFGMMAVEAMACGVPVICFENTALPDVIGAPTTGLSVPHGDHRGLLRAIEDLMGNPERRMAMGAEALKLVRREYTMQRYVERHVALYFRLARERRSSGS